jgi:hypothetical protein
MTNQNAQRVASFMTNGTSNPALGGRSTSKPDCTQLTKTRHPQVGAFNRKYRISAATGPPPLPEIASLVASSKVFQATLAVIGLGAKLAVTIITMTVNWIVRTWWLEISIKSFYPL